MNKLKPCPFCGGEAELRKYSSTKGNSFTVRCKNKCIVTCGHLIDGKWRPTKMCEAVELWNKRV